jgi:hypothetical protein
VGIYHLSRCFFAPRLKISTSALFRGIIGFDAPGPGLPVREGGPEWTRCGTVEVGVFGFEIIDDMRSDGLGAGRAAVRDAEAEEACGISLAPG